MSEEKKQPIYKKKWFWPVVIAVVVLGLISSATNKEKDSSTEESTQSAQSAQTTESSPDQAESTEETTEDKIKSYIKKNYMLEIQTYHEPSGDSGTDIYLWTPAGDEILGASYMKETCESLSKYILEIIPETPSITLRFYSPGLHGAGRCVYLVDNGTLTLDAEHWDEELE